MSEAEKYLVHKIANLIMVDSEVARYCDQVARKESGTQYAVLEEIEDTAQHDLYWSWYASTQSKLTSQVVTYLLPVT